MAIACTISDEKFFRIMQEEGEALCEQYDTCDECPYYDKHHPEEVNDA